MSVRRALAGTAATPLAIEFAPGQPAVLDFLDNAECSFEETETAGAAQVTYDPPSQSVALDGGLLGAAVTNVYPPPPPPPPPPEPVPVAPAFTG